MLTEEQIRKVYDALDGTSSAEGYTASRVIGWILREDVMPEFLEDIMQAKQELEEEDE